MAEGPSGHLWVTVKGFPKATARTHPSTQAGHWFKDALFDIVDWRTEDADIDLAIALPDFPRYRSLAKRVDWLRSTAPFFFIWVGEDGAVVVDRHD